MLATVLLVLVILLIVSAGGGVVWMVANEILAPLVATVGSLGVLAACAVALSLLSARQRVRRLESELRTVRRSQASREREPARYEESELSYSEPPSETAPPSEQLLRPLAQATNTEGEPARTVDEALGQAVAAASADGVMEMFLEPVLLMPAGQTVAYRAHPGMPDEEEPLAAASRARLGDHARAALDTGMVRRLVTEIAPRVKGLSLHIDVAPSTLANREAFDALRGSIEGATHGKPVLRLKERTADALIEGRIAELGQVGAGLLREVTRPSEITRAGAAELAAEDTDFVAIPAKALAAEPMAVRGARHLTEAGLAAIVEGVASESDMLDLVEQGLRHFSGPVIDRPRRVRPAGSDGSPSEGGAGELPAVEPTGTPATLPRAKGDADRTEERAAMEA